MRRVSVFTAVIFLTSFTLAIEGGIAQQIPTLRGPGPPGLGLPGGPAPGLETEKPLEPGQRTAPEKFPTVKILQPPNGAVINTETPQILVAFSDAGWGVDRSSMRIFLNG